MKNKTLLVIAKQAFTLVPIAFVLLLQACAQNPVLLTETGASKPQASQSSQSPHVLFKQKQQELQNIKQWNLKARISVTAEGESNAANLYWQQNGDDLKLKIQGPFGINVAQITTQDQEYILKDSKGGIWKASDVNQLVWERTGWRLPIKQLRYWVMGDMQKSKTTNFAFNTDGSLSYIYMQNWQIHYDSFKAVDGLNLPRKIRISHPEVAIKLVARAWTLNE